MKYLVLRDCYTNDRFYHEGSIVEILDTMKKSPKNFQLVEGQTPDVVEITEPPLYVSPKTKRKK